MAEERETDNLLSDIDELPDLGDLGDLGEFADGDLDSLLGDTDLDLDSEFGDLMDLSDFEELDPSGNMDGLFDIQTENWENDLAEEKPEKKAAEEEQEAKAVSEEVPEPVSEAVLSQDESEVSSQEEVQKEEAAAQEEMSAEVTDLEEMPAEASSQEENAEVQEQTAQEPEDEVQDLLDLGGASLQEKPNLDGIESVNDELLLDVPELEEEVSAKEKKAAKKAAKKEKKEKKPSIFKRVFGNVPDENAEKNAAKEAERQAAKEAKKAAKKTKEEIALEKQEKKKAKEEAAALKKAEQDAKKAQKEEQKKLKLAEKAAAKEAREMEEAKEPPTRINRVGAGVILVTFAIIAVVIIGGNNSYAYSQCITKAASYFKQQEYTNAYNQIYGVEVKKSDEELKDQVMTVMFIEKQRNSFDNYFAMEMYPEALDSLLKGLSKYDKYLEQARSLGIESDVNYVRDEILAELASAFNISEKKAYKLLSITDSEEYTKQVIAAASGN
jgi:chemotaxis protein histidine kinase CheA